jgi:hydrogenase maturation protease
MSSANSPGFVLVIGVGNSWAGDDAAGILVARMVSARAPVGVTVIAHEGEPTALIEIWAGARLAIVVDAISGGAAPGQMRCFDATRRPLPADAAGTSTHAVGLGEAIELARALRRLPEQLLVVGIQGGRFEAGAEAGPEVRAALHKACEHVLALATG